ncbi:hypothetical protein K437DRAFT_255840 [Tilletiaria anomala UBC 951]|uniref:Dynamitin-domain-containing protein n=1 Tax=Tilletiaria anomala (strain ATCC 24038 / CBS 436.72 / UBC 951) TaxID=1037660 RepID=A0A066W4T2_TILAU|nr:uncharacterized protein K437DRAFT_255840 [Tilletiaria anomala UBC 951]KDN47563.1 hypothetical protein K437DRAFT_255840 [Tilletiaria anomala UBC 951]
MSSKYGGLPDIDTAPDVYETEDVLESSSISARVSSSRKRDHEFGRGSSGSKSGSGGAAATQSEDIDNNGLSVAEAARRFQKSTRVDAACADFSGTLKRKPRAAAQIYPVTASFETETYELAGYSSTNGLRDGAGPSESRVDKLRRLRWEIEELEREVFASASASTSGTGIAAGEGDESERQAAAKGGQRKDKDVVPPAAILEQLAGLSSSLSRVEAAAASANRAGERNEWADATRELIRSLDGVRVGSTTSSSDTKDAVGGEAQGSAAATALQEGTTLPLPQLEGKVVELEKFVGVRDILMDETKGLQRPLIESVARLEHQLTLLTQPRQLDAISRRVKVLSTELERLHETKRKAPAGAGVGDGRGAAAAAASQSPADGGKGAAREGGGGAGAGLGVGKLDAETAQKLSTLFALQKRLEPLIPLGGSLLGRMRSLSALHASSSSFARRLDAAMQADAQLRRGQEELRALLDEAQESLQTNACAVQRNLDATETRIEGLMQRLNRLEQPQEK